MWQLVGFPTFGPLELVLILAVILIIFGVGRLPEIGGAIGKGIREFRREVKPPQGGDSGASTRQDDRETKA